MADILTEVYLISESDLEDPAQAAMVLSGLLNQISDRLDRLEGTRGDSTVQVPLLVVDADGNTIGGFTTS